MKRKLIAGLRKMVVKQILGNTTIDTEVTLKQKVQVRDKALGDIPF